jgi:hypothetical protein
MDSITCCLIISWVARCSVLGEKSSSLARHGAIDSTLCWVGSQHAHAPLISCYSDTPNITITNDAAMLKAKSVGASIVGPYTTSMLVAAHNSTGSGLGNGDETLATNCYNPTQHVFMSNTSLVYFSCTFVTTFAPQHHKTARYDYNSLMYRLDVSLV